MGFLAIGVCSVSVEEDVAFLGRNDDEDEESRWPIEVSLARIPNGDPRPREGESRP